MGLDGDGKFDFQDDNGEEGTKMVDEPFKEESRV